MKTLRYRSISSALVLVVLSISLFTSCDKELEDALKQPDRLVKFTSLSFTGETASTTSNAGTGTFTGTGSNNLRFIPPEDPENQEIASALEDGQEFTDPRST